jgi:aspartate kinase
VSAIGAGINATYANVRAGLAVLRRAAILCSGISTSSFHITWMVPDADVDRASRALRALFIESRAPRVP